MKKPTWYAVKNMESEKKGNPYNFSSVHDNRNDASEACEDMNFDGDDQPLLRTYKVVKVEINEV